MGGGRGGGQLVSKGQQVPVKSEAFAYLGRGFLLGLPVSIWVVAGALAVIGILSRRTAAGLFIESVGNNPVAARFTGVNERAVKFAVYALTGLCAGVAGLVDT